MANRRCQLLSLLLIPALGCIGRAKPQIGSWGDQGDGTYKNPILNADYPDVDIEQAGDIYYMLTSTIHYAPGMTLLASKDIVNWTIIGHVFNKLTWEPRYNFDQMSGYRFGVWAGDLAYHGGRWYCYFIDSQSGLYMSSAEKITGPWSNALCMLKKTGWTDPAVLWDDDQKQAYLVCNFGRDPVQKMNQTRLFRMSWDGKKLLDEGKAIYHGHGAEAAKIYKINGYYYIFLAEWIQGDRKQLVLRGKSIYGPLERRILMERAAGATRSVCQGALVQAPDGSWWLTHQLVQHREKIQGAFAGKTTGSSYEGRSQWLIPVKWQDGWPVLGQDPDGNGIGNTVHQWKKPIQGCPIDAPQTDDEFDAPKLSPQWQWNHNPRLERWSLTERPGWLRLKASVPISDGGFWNAANTLSQRLMGKGKGVVTAKVDIGNMKPGQQAGLCRHSGQYVLLGIRVDDDGNKLLLFNNNGKIEQGPVIREDIIYYRTKNDGNRAFYEYGLDGKTYKPFGGEFQLKFGRWRGDRLGFYCFNDKKADGSIDIDYFHYDYDGPKGIIKSSGTEPINRSDVTRKLGSRVVKILDEIEAATGLQVQFETLIGSYFVAQYRFDPHSNTATVSLRSDWEDVDVAHELMHMKLELVEGFAVLAWRSGVSKTRALDAAFARVRGYVDDEVVHARLVQEGFTLDGEVLKPQLFDDIYTKVPRYLQELRPKSGDGMAHLDGFGCGDLCRSSFLVQAELVRTNYSSALSDARMKKVNRFVSAFRTHRSHEAGRADEVLKLFKANDVMTPAGHKQILESWAKLEQLDDFVGPSIYTRQANRYILPWP